MKFYVFIVIILLQGCQQTSEQLIDKDVSDKDVKLKIICQQSTTPPIKNTQKLKEMLIANGKIDASLSDEEIDQAVNNYMRKKNSAFKNCTK
jgi:bacillopeptidase F (M6 metalloprotease family)